MRSHSVTCHPAEVRIPPLPPSEAGTRFSDPGGMQGGVDLGMRRNSTTYSQRFYFWYKWRKNTDGGPAEPGSFSIESEVDTNYLPIEGDGRLCFHWHQ